jgi:hypothetical protein
MKATNVIVEFQLNRKKFCRLPNVILRMTQFTADILYLFPPSQQLGTATGNPTMAPIQYISKTPAWLLFNEEICFQVNRKALSIVVRFTQIITGNLGYRLSLF